MATSMKRQPPELPVEYVSVTALAASEVNPRVSEDEEGIDTLVASIKAHGVLNPLVARKRDDGSLEVIAGNRRLRADFRTGSGSVTRRPRATWYASVVGAVERLPGYPPARERTAEESAEWLCRATAPTMAALAERRELDVASLLADGRRRWQPKHYRLIDGA